MMKRVPSRRVVWRARALCYQLPLAIALGALAASYPLKSGHIQSGALEWRAMTSPIVKLANRSSYAMLTAISCPTSQFCVAVGTVYQATASGRGYPLLETFDGRSWALQHVRASGAEPAHTSVDLEGVSCPSVRFCMVVGTADYGAGAPVVYVFSGRRWASVNSPARSGYYRAVSCPAVQRCIVVGSQGGPLGAPDSYVYLAGRWRRTVYRSEPSGIIDQTGIACLSTSWCEVVGDVGSGGPGMVPLAGHFDGSSWALAEVRQIGVNYEAARFADVSCSNSRICLGVGFTLSGSPGRLPRDPVAEALENGRWRSVLSSTPVHMRDTVLEAVSCRCGRCVVAGTRGQEALLVTYATGRWSPTLLGPTMRSGAVSPAGVLSMSCPAQSLCIAVGSAGDEPVTMEGSVSGMVP